MSIHPRIESAIRTAKQWESDKSLLTEIRASIPFEDLVPEQSLVIQDRCQSFLNDTAKGSEPDDASAENEAKIKLRESLRRKDDSNYEGDDLLLKRLTLYFKKEIMTWVNSPPCVNPNCKGNEDGKQMKNEGVRGAETEEEKVGQATRVESKFVLCRLEFYSHVLFTDIIIFLHFFFLFNKCIHASCVTHRQLFLDTTHHVLSSDLAVVDVESSPIYLAHIAELSDLTRDIVWI